VKPYDNRGAAHQFPLCLPAAITPDDSDRGDTKIAFIRYCAAIASGNPHEQDKSRESYLKACATLVQRRHGQREGKQEVTT